MARPAKKVDQIPYSRAELRINPKMPFTSINSTIQNPKSGPTIILGSLSVLYQKANILPSLRGVGFSWYFYMHKSTISFGLFLEYLEEEILGSVEEFLSPESTMLSLLPFLALEGLGLLSISIELSIHSSIVTS